ncbi:MAG: HEAT repeat domain-containing protein [Candidatus Obscuribacterales bacterium]|nr:HEAT repeat domain-containing protein [Candidatus Obscuribacterales bacterium]
MKQPTPRARKIIEALQDLLVAKNGTINDLQPEQLASSLELLQSLAAEHPFASIPYLLPFTLSPQKIIAETAASIVEGQAQAISSVHLLQLQDRLRGGEWNFSAHLSQWNAMKFDRLAHFFDSHPRLVAMSSFHHNGFVREAAVKYLNAQQSGVEFPFLLIRLTDWVAPIAARVKTALEARFNKDYLHHFIDNLLLIELLSKKKRGSAPEAIAANVFEQIHATLKAPENGPLLLKGLTASSWETRRMCLKLLKVIRAELLASDANAEDKLERTRENSRQVIEAVLGETDVSNRLLIFDFAQDLSKAEHIELMLRLGRDTAPSIRRNALETLCRIDSPSDQKNLEKGLLDRSPLVREFARYKLIKGGGTFDVRQFYLDKLQSKPSVKIISSILAGLGEVGSEEDVPILLEYIKHPQSGVRRFAMMSLGKLEPSGHDDIFLDMLNQPSIGLSRAASIIISELPEPVDGATLFEIFEQTEIKHVKLHAVRLFNSLPKWQRISHLLQAATSNQSEVKKMAITYVESWEQQYRTTFQYSLPSKEEASMFRQSVTGCDHNFIPQVKETLKACLTLCASTN